MTRASRIWLGIFTFLPIVLLFVYLFLIVFLVRDAIRYGDEDMPFPILPEVLWMIILALSGGLLSFGLLVYYIIHAINNKKIDSNERILWILIFLVGNIIAFPIYWFMRIWKDPESLSMAAN
jgi:hypothetical protein